LADDPEKSRPDGFLLLRPRFVGAHALFTPEIAGGIAKGQRRLIFPAQSTISRRPTTH
jgi:hypothetical protein